MFKHVLIPVDDFSLEPENFPKLKEFVKKEGGMVTLVHVSDPSPPVFYTQNGFGGDFVTTEEHRKACGNYANALFKKAGALIGDGAKVDSRHIFDDDVAHGIVHTAEDTHSDAIIMMSRKRRGLVGFFSDSKTVDVVRESKIPLVVL